MNEREREWLRKTLHLEFSKTLKVLDKRLKGRAYAADVTDALAEAIDGIVESCIDLADEEGGK